MAKSKNQESTGEVKNKTSLYIKPNSHNKIKVISIKENDNPNALFEKAIDEFIDRWEKKNGEITI